MTIDELIASYRTDKDSPYYGTRLRYCTRQHYDVLLKRISKDLGSMELEAVKARQLLSWHDEFLQRGHIAMGHGIIGMMRTIMSFGTTMLEDSECTRISDVLGKMRFKMGKPRVERLTSAQVVLIRAEAHKQNLRSIALAQAIQFELMLRQKDIIGEILPLDEPIESDVFAYGKKWARGIRWEEIDENFILKHVTSKRLKEITVDLKLADMVISELTLWFGAMDRSRMPVAGPVIFSERTKLPWVAGEFRRKWRQLADNCGIPKEVRNMDTRSGAITEATDAGIPLETIRHASTHSDISMVARYSRGSTEKIASVMETRLASRKA